MAAVKLKVPFALLSLVAMLAAADNFTPERYISQLPDSTEQKVSLKRYADAVRATLDIDTSDRLAVLQAYGELRNSAACVFQNYVHVGSEDTVAKGLNDQVHLLRQMTSDTPARQEAFARFIRAASNFDRVSIVLDGKLRLKPPVCIGEN